MAKQPEQKPGRSKQNYATPACFMEPVKRRLGISEFVIDLAADAENTKAIRFFDKAADSLMQDWPDAIGDGWAWLNPPYANIGEWARKCAATAEDSDSKIAFLVPAGVGANWYRDYVHRAHAHTLFLNGRIPFMPDQPTWLYPKDCILVLYAFGYQGNDVWTWREKGGA